MHQFQHSPTFLSQFLQKIAHVYLFDCLSPANRHQILHKLIITMFISVYALQHDVEGYPSLLWESLIDYVPQGNIELSIEEPVPHGHATIVNHRVEQQQNNFFNFELFEQQMFDQLLKILNCNELTHIPVVLGQYGNQLDTLLFQLCAGRLEQRQTVHQNGLMFVEVQYLVVFKVHVTDEPYCLMCSLSILHSQIVLHFLQHVLEVQSAQVIYSVVLTDCVVYCLEDDSRQSLVDHGVFVNRHVSQDGHYRLQGLWWQVECPFDHNVGVYPLELVQFLWRLVVSSTEILVQSRDQCMRQLCVVDCLVAHKVSEAHEALDGCLAVFSIFQLVQEPGTELFGQIIDQGLWLTLEDMLLSECLYETQHKMLLFIIVCQSSLLKYLINWLCSHLLQPPPLSLEHFLMLCLPDGDLESRPPLCQFFPLHIMIMQSLFDYEVETMTVDSDKLAEVEQAVQKSYSFADWIKLLNMHKHNQSWKNVDRVVNSMQRRFLLRQAFCDRELREKIERIDKGNRDHVKQVFAMFDRSMTQGEYVELAKKLCNFVLEMYTRGTITLTVAQNRIEALYSKFKEDIENGSFFLHKLRKLYKAKQCPDGIMKIRKAYQQEISTPFTAIDVTLDQYLSWEKDELEIQKTKQLYQKTKLRLDAIHTMSNQQKLSNSSPKTVLNLLEAQNNINQQLYLQKLKLLPAEQQLERLCRQSKQGRFVDLYLNNLQKLETQQVIRQQFRRLIHHCQGKKKYLLQKRYLQLLVSSVNKHLMQEIDQEYTSKWVANIAQFRQEAQKIISDNKQTQKKAEILNLWADVEAYVISDAQSTKIVSDRVIQLTKDPKYFKDYASRLIFLKEYKDALKILQNAMQDTGQPSLISGQLKRFQVLFGQKTHYQQLEFNGKATPKKQQNGQPKTPAQKAKRPREIPVEEAIDDKIQNEVKRRHHNDSGRTVYMNNIHELTEKQIIQLLQLKSEIEQVRIVKDKNGKSRGFCYIDYKTTEAAEKECRQFKHANIQIHISRPHKQYSSDEKTLFLCGLPATATQDKVRQMLASVNKDVSSLRLIQNQQGTRGYCYVQFENQILKDRAFEELLHKKMTIDGKRILIQECDSNRQKSKKSHQVIFIQNLSYKATQQDIRDFFKHHKIEPMTIEIPRKGDKSRGIAYVEFEKFVDFQKALDLKEGRIHQRDFKILRSDREITHKKQKKQEKLETNDDFSKMCS